MEALPYAAVLVDRDGAVLAANTAALAIFTPLDRAGLPRTFKEFEAPHLIVGLRDALAEVECGGPGVTLIGAARDAGGRRAMLDIALAPVRAADGDVTAVIVTAVERSNGPLPGAEREQIETLNEELRATNDALQAQIRQLAEAEAADARKNQFMAMLAHELRNPLGAVVNAVHLIRRLTGRGDRRVDRALRVAERQLRHEARLLDDLLDVSRIVLGKITLRLEPLDLRDCVRNGTEGATFAIQSQAQSVDLTLPDESLLVAGDATRLEQCIGNLLSNAVKFTPAGGRISISAERQGDEAVVRVCDEGIGIAQDMLDRVFDLFAQADASLARSRGGLGIGLTLVRRLVDLHRGRVAARSEGPGRGSQFEIRLPLVATMPSPARAPAGPAPGSQRILIVEDNRDAREMLRLVFEMDGHTVFETGDATTAMRLAIEKLPTVALIDLGLPDLDGFEVARRIRSRLGESVRLIALTGYGDGETQTRSRDAGFDLHLVKPVDPPDLLQALSGDLRPRSS